MSDLDGLLKSTIRMDEGGCPLASSCKTMSPPTRPEPPTMIYFLSSFGGSRLVKSIGSLQTLSYVSCISSSVHGCGRNARASSGTEIMTL